MEIYSAAASIIDLKIASERHVCEILSLNRSSFQTWKRFECSLREENDVALLPVVIAIFKKHHRRYGSRRIVEDLKQMKIQCSRRRVAKLLKIAGLQAIQPKSFKPRTTESKHRLGYSPRAIARSGPVKTGVDTIQYGVIPSGSHTFAANVVFHSGVALQNVQSHTPNCG